MKQFFVQIGNAIVHHKILTAVVAAVIILVIVFSCLGALVFNRISVGTVPSEEDLKNSVKYSRVVIFGVDGAGDYFSKCDTPSFDRVYANGSVTYEGVSQYPTISAQNWTSMLHGVGCGKHGITNSIADTEHYTDTKYPSLFKVYGEAVSGANMASIVNWKPINFGIIEENIGVTKINAKETIEGESTEKEVDVKAKELALDYISESAPDILFIHWDNVDHMGHEHGYGTAEYEQAVKEVDGYIGEVYSKYIQNGWGSDTLFITVSDHGHVSFGGHGGNSPTVKNITVAVAGGLGNVIKGTPKHTCAQDVASIALYALGIKQPESWESKVPNNMFRF